MLTAKEILDNYIKKVESRALRVEDYTEKRQSFYTDINGFKFNFITFCSQGIKNEGELIKWFPSEIEAIIEFCRNFSKGLYLENFVLIWRSKPEIRRSPNGFTVRCRVQTI